MHQSRRAFSLLFLSILSAGYLASETAVILPALLAGHGFTPAQGGWLISVRFLGGSLSSFLMIALGSRVSFRAYLGAAAGLVVVTSAVLPWIDGYTPLLTISFARGTALTFFIAPTNAALSVWFWKKAGVWSSRVHSAFGIGLILAPVLGFATVTLGLPWQAVWMTMGLVALLLIWVAVRAPAGRAARGSAGRPTHPAADVSVVDAPAADAPHRRGTPRSGAAAPQRARAKALGSPGLPARYWILPVVLATFNVGIEGSIIGWVPSYVELTGGAAWYGQIAGLLLAVGIVLGRTAATRLSGRVRLLSVYEGSILTVAGIALLLLPLGVIRPIAAPLLGIAMAALYPSMIARFADRARATDGRLYPVTELAATVGGTALPAAIGLFSESYPGVGFPATLIGASAVLLVFSRLLHREEKRRTALPSGSGS